MPDERRVQEDVGHPLERWEALKERVQTDGIGQFSHVQAEWLDLMWCLDAFRIAGVMPAGSERESLEALNRGKGNFFASLIALLLQNQTSAQPIGARTKVQGFSQEHQIDVAWPDRPTDPLICAETKVTGSPATPQKPTRGAFDDFYNRRKELKFAATDLKLFRRQHATVIRHWDVWRRDAPPKVFFLWAARLRTKTDGPGPEDSVIKMAHGAQALINTYLDGAGVFPWRLRSTRDGYEPVPLPPTARITTLDDVLYRIASEINNLVGPEGIAPPPHEPDQRAIDADPFT